MTRFAARRGEATERMGDQELSVSYVADDEDPDVIASSVTGVRFAEGAVPPTYDVLLHAH